MSVKSKNIVTRKDWDSDFFGYEIGTIDISEFTKDEVLTFKEGSFQLFYLFSTNPIEDARFDYSGVLLDLKKGIDAENVIEVNKNIVIAYSDFSNFEVLKKLALQSGEYSRFAKDPNFKNGEYEKLYVEWIYKSLHSNLIETYIYSDNNEVCGFITLEKDIEAFSIGLLGVDYSKRGRGIGKALVNKCISEARKHNQKYISVKTQGDNIPAILLYQKLGFEIVKTNNVYHLWNI